jgi:ferredoxin-like protein FixX
MADKVMTAGEQADALRLERERLMLEKETLELDKVREEVADRTAQKEYRTRKSRLRQSDARNVARRAANVAKACSHRQGGQNGDMLKGKGPTALKVEKHPDGFTIKIRCLCCPLRVTNPIPSNASKKIKRGENAEMRDERVAQFARDKALFDKLYEQSQENALSVEASAAMECGTTFKVTDEDGNQIFKPRPSDGYANEMAVMAALG